MNLQTADLLCERMLDDIHARDLSDEELSAAIDDVIASMLLLAPDHYGEPPDHAAIQGRIDETLNGLGRTQPNGPVYHSGDQRERPRWVYETLISEKKVRYKVRIAGLVYGGSWKTQAQAEHVRDRIVAEMRPARPILEVLAAAAAIVAEEKARVSRTQ